jgi:hypothetical protein
VAHPGSPTTHPGSASAHHGATTSHSHSASAMAHPLGLKRVGIKKYQRGKKEKNQGAVFIYCCFHVFALFSVSHCISFD